MFDHGYVIVKIYVYPTTKLRMQLICYITLEAAGLNENIV